MTPRIPWSWPMWALAINGGIVGGLAVTLLVLWSR